MSISIIGTYHSKFGRLEESVYELLVKAGRGALKDAGLEADKIGGVWLGNFSAGGFNRQEHLAPYAVNIDPGLRFTPMTRVENACASGSAAIEAARNALEAGEVEYALVIGVEKMTSLNTKGVTEVLAMASHWASEGAEGMTFPGLFAEYAKGYLNHYDLNQEDLRTSFARIAAKNHNNAVQNPLAHMPWECTAEEILDLSDDKNPIIADPLRLYDCSLVSDGTAAVVLTTTEKARKLKDEAVEIKALAHTTDYLRLTQRQNYEFTAGKKAIEQAFASADIKLSDLDFVEVHDCFTIAEVLAYEALGLAEPGEGWKIPGQNIVEPGGEIPVNLSGGLKAKGHPVGTTGVSMAVLAARQLLGKAIGIQVPGAKMGLTFNIGGSAASNYALIYRKI